MERWAFGEIQTEMGVKHKKTINGEVCKSWANFTKTSTNIAAAQDVQGAERQTYPSSKVPQLIIPWRFSISTISIKS